MSFFFRSVVTFLLTTMLLGCAGSGTGSGSGGDGGRGVGGLHFPRPGLDARQATIADGAAGVEMLLRNPTDAPLWVRRLWVDLSIGGAVLASGEWAGERRVDPGTSVLFDLALPLVEGITRPVAETPGVLTVRVRYARSGLLGLLGGESMTGEFSVAVVSAD